MLWAARYVFYSSLPPFFPSRHLTNSFLQRATLTEPASTSPWPKGLGNLVKLCRAGDRALQLLLFNEECLVSASHQLALITSLPLKDSINNSTRGTMRYVFSS